jgi:hypothetical protein
MMLLTGNAPIFGNTKRAKISRRRALVVSAQSFSETTLSPPPRTWLCFPVPA